MREIILNEIIAGPNKQQAITKVLPNKVAGVASPYPTVVNVAASTQIE